MKKYLFILGLLIISETSLKAQPDFSDSLRYVLKNSSAVDTNYVKNIITAIIFLPYSQPDSGLYYADYALKLSNQLNFTRGIAYSYRMMAECYIYTGDYSKAIFYIYQHLNLFTEMDDIAGINLAYGQLSAVYGELGNYSKSLEYMLKGRKNIIAIGYEEKNNWIYTGGTPQISFYDQGLAFAYLNEQMVDSAFKYGERAFLADPHWSIMPILMGDIFLKKHDYITALKFYNIKTTNNYPVDSVKNFIGKATAFNHIQQQDSSSIFALKALDIARRIKYAKGILQASELLSNYYEKLEPYKSIEYLKISNSIRDSLYNKSRINQVNSIVFNDELRRLDALASEKVARDRYMILSLVGVMFTFLVTGILLWRNVQHRKKANTLLQHQKEKVENTLAELKSTQAQLIQSEKMASLGQLTAGIAHEIQNPLNFVNNFSEVSNELIMEIEVERAKSQESRDETLVSEILADVKDNLGKITLHGKRADAIVKGMLEHSRTSSGEKMLTDINALADEYLGLSYHGMRAKDKTFKAEFVTDFDPHLPYINIVPQEIGRVLLNIFNNAFYACMEQGIREKGLETKTQDGPNPYSPIPYTPLVKVSTKNLDGKIEISISDNGPGIPDSIKDKIFQPFFTTKPTGQGTGLGLSLSYDIVKAHGGDLKVETKEGVGTDFMIILPFQNHI